MQFPMCARFCGIAFLLTASLVITACGGGGGGGAGPVATVPTTALPDSATSSVSVDASGSATVALGPVLGGYSASVTLPAASNPASLSATLTTTQPGETPVVQNVRRRPAFIGGSVKNLLFFAVRSNATVSFPSPPTVTITFPYAAASLGSCFLAIYDPTANPQPGWTTIAGPGTPSGNTLILYGLANPVPLTLKAGVTYYFVLFTFVSAPPAAGGYNGLTKVTAQTMFPGHPGFAYEPTSFVDTVNGRSLVRVWWCGADPDGQHGDTVYYSESTDLKNWIPPQRHIGFNPNYEQQIGPGYLNTACHPTVVKHPTDGSYRMFYECNVRVPIGLATPSNVCSAKSTDNGYTWSVWGKPLGGVQPDWVLSSQVAFPLPIIQPPGWNNYYMYPGHPGKGYGLGHPSALVTNNEIWLYYYVNPDQGLPPSQVWRARISASFDTKSVCGNVLCADVYPYDFQPAQGLMLPTRVYLASNSRFIATLGAGVSLNGPCPEGNYFVQSGDGVHPGDGLHFSPDTSQALNPATAPNVGAYRLASVLRGDTTNPPKMCSSPSVQSDVLVHPAIISDHNGVIRTPTPGTLIQFFSSEGTLGNFNTYCFFYMTGIFI